MIIIKDNKRVYMIESTYTYGECSRWDQALLPDNMPLFKAVKSNVLIGGNSFCELEAIRYLRLPFPSTLNAPELTEKVLPKIKGAMKECDRLDEDGEIAYMAFAKGEKAFILTNNFLLAEVQTEKAFGWQAERLRYALATTQGQPLMQRVKNIYRSVSRLLKVDLFPLIMMDTKSFQISIIKEDEV